MEVLKYKLTLSLTQFLYFSSFKVKSKMFRGNSSSIKAKKKVNFFDYGLEENYLLDKVKIVPLIVGAFSCNN